MCRTLYRWTTRGTGKDPPDCGPQSSQLRASHLRRRSTQASQVVLLSVLRLVVMSPFMGDPEETFFERTGFFTVTRHVKSRFATFLAVLPNCFRLRGIALNPTLAVDEPGRRMRYSPIPGAVDCGFGVAQGWLLCYLGCELVVTFLLSKLQAAAAVFYRNKYLLSFFRLLCVPELMDAGPGPGEQPEIRVRKSKLWGTSSICNAVKPTPTLIPPS